jgi:MFS family permease
VIDDGVSKRLTLNQGANVIRAAIVNAGGATDFCARFLDENDRPIKTLTATLTGSDMKSLRWRMMALLMIGSIINYLTRSTLGVAAPTILQDLHITTQQYSWIVSTFQGAIMLQPICGYVLDVVGLKAGFAMFAIAWSFVSMAHGLAHSWPAFAVLRGLLGFAEGCANPAGMKATAEWFPAKERGLAGGLFNIGASVGSMLAPPLVVWAILDLQLAGGVRDDRPHRSRVGGAVAGLLPLARSSSEALRRRTRLHRLGPGAAPAEETEPGRRSDASCASGISGASRCRDFSPTRPGAR